MSIRTYLNYGYNIIIGHYSGMKSILLITLVCYRGNNTGDIGPQGLKGQKGEKGDSPPQPSPPTSTFLIRLLELANLIFVNMAKV